MRLRTTCLIPAAGMSSRMGRAKPLVEFGGRPLIHWAVTHAASACESVVVVLGHAAEHVRPAIPEDPRITVVTNDKYAEGMLSSIRRGFREVVDPWCFIAPADMPFLIPAIYREIFHQAHPDRNPRAYAWFPVYQTRRGHPVLVNTAIRAALDHTDAKTMRELLSPHPVGEIPVDDDAIGIDLDTDAALVAYAARGAQLA